jgi:LmbE family N-acetylglucosaminyl deacetylase/6-phosphogluconolactonase/glucosamine-6-phosphate isomerase/deaminase
MAPIRVIPARDEANIDQKLVTLLLAAVQEKPDLIISVFAGTPAFGAYHLLVERARSELMDFSRVRFVVFDELLSNAAAHGGNRDPGAGRFRAVLDERLFFPLAVPADNVIAFSPARDRAAETARIASFLAFSGIDIALLSVDSRGHIGFHVNGSNLDSTAGIVKVENAQRWQAREAFSLGLADLAKATRILLFAAGRNLAEIVQRLTEGTFDPSVPISVLQRHGNVILVADAGASSSIAREERIHGLYSGFLIVDEQSVPNGRRVLVVSPHPDDASISVGGTMAMVSGANRVMTAVMTTGHRSFIYGTQRSERIAIREAEVVKESRFLGAEPRFLRLPFYDGNYEITERDIDIFITLLRELDPDWIFTPHPKDSHPAHIASRAVVVESLRRYLAGTRRVVELWNYEGPWALFNRGDFNSIVTVPRLAFERKLQAIRAHESQVARTPYDVAAESLARLRSALVPESELAGFGARPPRLDAWIELFRSETVRGEPAGRGAGTETPVR